MSAPSSARAAVGATPLVFENVSHWYGDVVAVNNITAAVEAGITGLLGPNGAGKTTLLQLAAGLMPPSGGEVRVFGESPVEKPEIFRHVALVPEREALPGMLSARAFVEARATLLGMRDVKGAAQRALELVEMDTVADRRVHGFSKGMRQRTKLAAALVHEPRLVLLDEPFNGLDPRQRLHMMHLLETRAADGTAVLLSSHILEEIEGVASRILVMLSGRLAASGDHRTLRRMMTDRPHTVRLRASNVRVLAARLVAQPSVMGVEVESTDALVVRTTDYTAFSRLLVRAAHGEGGEAPVTLYDVQPTDESLEHVFAYLVER
ncbi:ABC transporter ATP-binding protein [Gemmatimonas sp.]|jgi:ABC-2 type transport system ATP-binding protein|uniref:ABC transporter ATP-binding protein n=1 Tax=Gemmatimonas sp. TaxID=1962908 RepID=UPI00391874FF